MKLTIACLAIFLVSAAFGLGEEHEFVSRYDNYRVYKIEIESALQLEVLQAIDSYPDGFMFWEPPYAVGKSVKLQVPPHKLGDLGDLVKRYELNVELVISNVQEKVESVKPKNVLRDGEMDWISYHTNDEINAWLATLPDAYPGIVTRISPATSFEGRSLEGVKISYNTGNPAIFIEGGIHAREWVSPATATFVINEFLTSTDAEVRRLAENFDWYIVPVTNPDGYTHTHTTTRMWRKTRQPHGLICTGADPNRNFAFMWMQGGASSIPCADTFAGPNPFSEPETAGLAAFYGTIVDDVMIYISFHSFSQMLLIPFGHTAEHLGNHNDSMIVGQAALDRLVQRFGTQYVLGNIAETIYIATGGSIDWIKADQGTQLTYTYELRDTGDNGFLLPPEQIIPNGLETLDSLIGMVEKAVELGY